ncbi:hypothetical protein ACIO3O_07400 [Streptomyces sp. NPDC087440]|uniref:hypothetical protein n=1 Tax=Streptomyces sp. NPDC087440 TaxID=3365790 RepID=UPI00381D722D
MRRRPVLLLFLVFAVMHVALLPQWVFSGDSYRYAVAALRLTGTPEGAAHAEALRAYCSAQDLQPYADCLADVPAGLRPYGERYESIFAARPGYPLLTAPLVLALGVLPGMWLTGLALSVVSAWLVGLLLREAGYGPRAVLGGQALLLFGPLGYWSMRPLTEGAVLACVLACTLGAYRLVSGRPSGAWVPLGVGFGVLAGVKYSSALMVGVGLGVAGLVLLVRTHLVRPDLVRTRKAARHLAVAGASGVAGLAGLSWLLGLPGPAVAAQDLLTEHFTRPDVANPGTRIAMLAVRYWAEWARDETAFVVLLGLAGWLLWRRGDARLAVTVAAAGAVGFLTASALPGANELDRLWVLMWLPVVVGLPGLGRFVGPRTTREEGPEWSPPLRSLPGTRTAGAAPAEAAPAGAAPAGAAPAGAAGGQPS